jgi:hypothetical protein
VTRVELYVDNTLKSTDTVAPYTFSLDTTTLTNGGHTLQTKAYDAAGNIGSSNPIGVTVSNTTSDTTPPSTPTNLSATAISSSQINLSWSASTDPDNTTSQISYKVYRGGTQVGTTAAGVTTYADTGLSPSTQYTYTIAASDPSGNTSGQSAGASATTQGVVVISSSTLFTTQIPVLTHLNDGQNYEMGTEFGSTVPGTITGIRFYKDASETGVHTGHIWNGAGTLLASVTFTNETASGWQQANLTSPLTIASNTTYVVSVNTGNQYYVATNYGLSSKITNGSLYSVVGTNGVYGSPGAFPTNSFESSNYFRDVVFSIATSTNNKFSIGERVQTTARLNVRATACTNGKLLGTQAKGALGTITGGPTTACGYTWWKIIYNAGASGWSIQNYLI